MNSFGIHFLFCNIFISIILGFIVLAKKMLKNRLSGCIQYHIWFLLPIIFTLPFLSIRPAGLPQIIHWFYSIKAGFSPTMHDAAALTAANPISSADWITDFHISVTRSSAPTASCIPFLVWLGGILVMTVFMINSRIRLYQIEQSALPLQNQNVKRLYRSCKAEMQIKRTIPIYSAAFLKSPIIVGTFRPRIYLPIHLISDFKESDMRYMLLHELQHYKHKDAFLNCLMNLAAIIYWFNPVVWYVLKEVRSDREVACDTYVLQMLDADDYIAYGNTLLNFAQKISLFPVSLTAGIGGSKKQLKKRILNIAGYQPMTWRMRLKEYIAFVIISVLILESTVWIPAYAADTKATLPTDASIHIDDLSSYFADYEGCFVLYDTSADTWDIYNKELAVKRFSPNSTYKPYSALFALENQYITPDASLLKWNGIVHSYPEWNKDQTLHSAMQNSVNWYFQTLDQQADLEALKDFYQTIGYGNCDLSGGVSEFWMESSLKISAVEQVELLKKLYTNDFHFDNRNVAAVKDSLKLSVSGASTLSGKTGTGVLNGESVNGWFIGYVESNSNTWFFATNIHSQTHASSLTASEITQNILADKHIYYID